MTYANLKQLKKALRKKIGKKTIWIRGYDSICRISKDYSIRECRIGAMMYEKGWKTSLRNQRSKHKTPIIHTKSDLNRFVPEDLSPKQRSKSVNKKIKKNF